MSARADRIERRSDGSYAILDYKDRLAATAKQVRMGLSRSSRWKRRSCAKAALPDRRAVRSAKLALCQAERKQSAGEHRRWS